jgi:hypothetical protein
MPGLTVEGRGDEIEDEEMNPAWNVASPRTDSESGATWESGSELTSVVSGSSTFPQSRSIFPASTNPANGKGTYEG